MRAAAVLVLALVLAGCGGVEDDGAEPGDPPPPPAAEEPAAVLEVTVWPTGRDTGPEHTTTLECDPPGGTHPLPEEACAALAASPDALDPVPGDAICTQIYGGPNEARVRGTFAGRDLDVTFNRRNGCEISRWDALEPLFRVALG